MHILSGVKPAEIFMICPTVAAMGEEKEGGGGGGDEVAELASWGRHDHMEWLEDKTAAVRAGAERMNGWREEIAGMMDGQTEREEGQEADAAH